MLCCDVWRAGLKWHSTHLPFVSPSLCCLCVRVLQMLGRTWGRQQGAFSRLCPSIASGVWPHPPRTAPTVASRSGPPIISRFTCGYTQVSIPQDVTSPGRVQAERAFLQQLNIYCTSCKIYFITCADIPSGLD